MQNRGRIERMQRQLCMERSAHSGLSACIRSLPLAVLHHCQTRVSVLLCPASMGLKLKSANSAG